MSEAPTAKGELIEALQGVTDLDRLHVHISNEYLDKFAPPRFSRWLVELVNAERGARESAAAEVDYPMYDFSNWPPRELYGAATVSLMIGEAAIVQGEPTVLNFCLRLQALVVGSMGMQLLETAWLIEQNVPQA